jgi:hypothetical protein
MAVIDNPSELTEQMFASIGAAITRWSFVEEQMCWLLAVCLGGAVERHDDALEFIELWSAMWIYYAVDNFRPRLQIVDAAFTSHVRHTACEQEMTVEWARLSKKARDLSLERNKLAHWTVKPAQRTGTAEPHEPIAPARLLPPIGSPKWYQETGYYGPSGKTRTELQVRQLEKAFCILERKLREFIRKLVNVEELRDKSSRQARDRLLLDGRLDQSLQAALLRAIPSPE